ncbi:MAG: multidrug ABC transporter [Legionellales bacterium RIFCSPHIGHO2_12_FULL_37_14]|nr:MAG: multidrug ABC transporter [Legionellales bacterium RIFCSPHIGHO2_12_FULL_37_14]
MNYAYAIDIKDITKVFGAKTVVDKISLQVNKGAVFGFLGSNGSGKTTMIRMICGLLTPTSGSGTCLGYDIKTQSAEIKRKIGYMPQKFCLYFGLTVSENLRFFADIYQMDKRDKMIEAIVADLELKPYLNIKAANLSGGWKQRLTLACCLLHQPELVFLDEPTAGIDPKARKDFWDYLHKIAQRDGTTVLVTTHYMDEAEKCTDLAYVNLGHLLYIGKTKEIIPFSQVKAVVVDIKAQEVAKLDALIKQDYPQLLASMVNNTFRVSSRDEALLNKFSKEQAKQYKLHAVTPSFEEVFIGLMQ